MSLDSLTYLRILSAEKGFLASRSMHSVGNTGIKDFLHIGF